MLIERLENRRLFTTVVTGIQLIGPVRAVTGIMLTFNQSLDPATAQDVKAYAFGRPVPKSKDSGGGLGGFLPFAVSRHKTRGVKNGHVQIASAIYDDAAHTVTLNTLFPFKAMTFLKFLRVSGQGTDGLKDAGGNFLDGDYDGTAGGDFRVRWKPHHAKQIRYVDTDGDIVTLTVKGPGQLFGFLRRDLDPAPILYADGTKPGRSSLIATIKKGANGDGIAHINQFVGASSVSTDLFSNTAFQVQFQTP